MQKTLAKITFPRNRYKFRFKGKRNTKISSSVDFSKEKILEDLNENGKKLLNLLAFEQKDLEDEYFV